MDQSCCQGCLDERERCGSWLACRWKGTMALSLSCRPPAVPGPSRPAGQGPAAWRSGEIAPSRPERRRANDVPPLRRSLLSGTEARPARTVSISDSVPAEVGWASVVDEQLVADVAARQTVAGGRHGNRGGRVGSGRTQRPAYCSIRPRPRAHDKRARDASQPAACRLTPTLTFRRDGSLLAPQGAAAAASRSARSINVRRSSVPLDPLGFLARLPPSSSCVADTPAASLRAPSAGFPTPLLHRDSYSLSFRPEPVVVLPKKQPSLPRMPYFWAPVGAGGDPNAFLGRPTPVPATSIGLVDSEPTSTTAPAAPAAPPFPALGATTPLWTVIAAGQTVPKPVVASAAAPTASPAVVQPTTTAAWPTVEYAVPSGADNRWASVDYLLSRDSREGLGGEHRFGEQRTFSNTLRCVPCAACRAGRPWPGVALTVTPHRLAASQAGPLRPVTRADLVPCAFMTFSCRTKQHVRAQAVESARRLRAARGPAGALECRAGRPRRTSRVAARPGTFRSARRLPRRPSDAPPPAHPPPPQSSPSSTTSSSQDGVPTVRIPAPAPPPAGSVVVADAPPADHRRSRGDGLPGLDLAHRPADDLQHGPRPQEGCHR